MDRATFEDIARRVFEFVRLDKHDEEEFLTNDVARAITMAPYVCRSIDADRYAVQNAVTFIAAIKDKAFDARPEDFENYLARRLQSVFNFPGDETKKSILMARLAKRALADYEADVEQDADRGQYNPILSGDISRGSGDVLMAARLPDEDIDRLFSQEQAANTFWWG